MWFLRMIELKNRPSWTGLKERKEYEKIYLKACCLSFDGFIVL